MRSDRQFNIYIEYKLENPKHKNPYSLHISLKTIEEAQALFELMRDRWRLPVSFEDNHIIVNPLDDSSNRGVICHDFGSKVGIQFGSDGTKNEFYKSIKPTLKNHNRLTKLPKMQWEFGIVTFDKYFFIHPDFSLEKRIKISKQIIEQFALMAFVLRDPNFCIPNDVIFIIMHQFIITSSECTRLIALNDQFLLPQNININQRYKRINCDVMYTITNKKDCYQNFQVHLHLICSDKLEAVELYDQIKDAGLDLRYQLNNNEIIIHPHLFKKYINLHGTDVEIDKETGKKEIGIVFDSMNELDTFLDIVNIKIQGKNIKNIRDNGIYFSEQALELREDLSHLDSNPSDMIEKQINEIVTYIQNSMIDDCDNIIDQLNGDCDVFSRFSSSVTCFFSTTDNMLRESTKKVIIICANHLIDLIKEGIPKNISFNEIIPYWLNSIIPGRNARVEAIFHDTNGSKVDATKMEFLIEMQKKFGDDITPKSPSPF